MLSRRAVAQLAAVSALATTAMPARAGQQAIRIGINLSLTGADAVSAARIKHGALMAFDDINVGQALRGYRLEPLLLDDATPHAGRCDPGQAAINARQMVSDPAVVAAIGPMMSAAGRAMAPVLSRGNLATITPSSTRPEITDPREAARFRPAGKAIYFRTVTTDAWQGPHLANYFADLLRVRSVYVLDDNGAYGRGIADAFQRRAEEKGIQVLGRDRLDAQGADYTPLLARIKALGPDALYYGGYSQAGVKLAKQSYDLLPHAIKGGGDGLYSAEMLSVAGFPAANGWYCTIAAPHTTEDEAAGHWVRRYLDRYRMEPSDYSVTAYNAALVIADAASRLIAEGKEVNRDNMRDYIHTARVKTLQGIVSFDANGDLQDRTISVFQIKKDANHAADDMVRQYHYIGAAPQS